MILNWDLGIVWFGLGSRLVFCFKCEGIVNEIGYFYYNIVFRFFFVVRNGCSG